MDFDRTAAAALGWKRHRESYEISQRARRNAALERVALRPCEHCGQPGRLDQSRQRFCSRSCSATANNVARGKQQRRWVTCEVCGDRFRPSKGQVRCSVACRTSSRHKLFIERWLLGTESGGKNGSVSVHIRRWLIEKYGCLCSRCGWSEVNTTTGRVPINVDHIDGDSENNRPDNLRLLCPNCHSLTSTYGSLNRGRGRKARYNRT